MSNWSPTGNYIVVSTGSKEQTESGLLYLPEVEGGFGTVVAANDDRPYKAGDEVLFANSDLVHNPALPQGQALIHVDFVFAWRKKE